MCLTKSQITFNICLDQEAIQSGETLSNSQLFAQKPGHGTAKGKKIDMQRKLLPKG